MPKDDKKDKEKEKKETPDTKRVVPKTVEIKEAETSKKEEDVKKDIPEEKKKDVFDNLDEPVEKKSGFPWLIFILTLIFATAGGLGGYFAYQKGVEKGKGLVSSPAPIVENSPLPSASPAAELKRSDLTLEVLNGTGGSGLASEAKTFLEGKGYVISKIDNASAFGTTETQISIKDSKKGYIEILKSDISEKYPVASDSSGLSEESPYDAIITIGQ